MPEFQDRILNCVDCGAEFIFTAGEQLFFHDRNFKNEPKRCKACKTKKQGANTGHGKTETLTTCSQCGRQTTVPFKPTQGRPVYCRECFQSRRTVMAAGG
jgi:CxxC-x17-CxxC domain-containing protein